VVKMNVFVLDEDPKQASEYHCDKHVLKMILEYTQLMSTAHHELGYGFLINENNIYKATHVNHPAAIWTRDNNQNYGWLWRLARNLCNEYTKRYGKTHKTEEMIIRLSFYPADIKCTTHKTPFWSPKGYEYGKGQPFNSAVEAYRQYYMVDKKDIVTWKNDVPNWYKRGSDE